MQPQKYSETPSGAQLDAMLARERDAWITAELIEVFNARDRRLLVSLLERSARDQRALVVDSLMRRP